MPLRYNVTPHCRPGTSHMWGSVWGDSFPYRGSNEGPLRVRLSLSEGKLSDHPDIELDWQAEEVEGLAAAQV